MESPSLVGAMPPAAEVPSPRWLRRGAVEWRRSVPPPRTFPSPDPSPIAVPSPRVPHAVAVLAAIAPFALSSGLPGQRLEAKPEVPIAVHDRLLADPAKAATQTGDPGPVVRLLESPNVDRFLRRAQDFLGRSDWPNAIRVIQDVIEGRTLEEGAPAGAEPAEVPAPAKPNPQPAPGPGVTRRTAAGQPEAAQPVADDPWRNADESGAQSVFSADERLYRPVQRLCHELLASLPPEGVAWYRTQFEVIADREYAAALRARDVSALELVYDRWFLTRAAGKALRAAGDLFMDQGRMRAAHQAYRRLLDVYPESARRESGIDELWLRARLMLCLALLGERASAEAAVEELRSAHAEDSLRIQGELVPVKGLLESEAFRGIAVAKSAAHARARLTAMDGSAELLVPLFEHRFSDPQPYRPARGQNDNSQVIFIGNDGEGLSATPKFTDFQPGGHVLFLPGGSPDSAQLAFLDHYRLTLVDAASGKVLAATSLDAVVPSPASGTPRTRIPAYDWSLLRASSDEARVYTVIGPSGRKLAGIKPVLRTTLEARSRADLSVAWSTEASAELRDVTYLAAPVVEGGKLYAPVMHAGTFWLLCQNAQDGAVLFRTPLHREGTEFAKPTAVPVVIDSGAAYVLTNAGVLAAVDVLSGAVKWLRRYERIDPLRPPRKKTNSEQQRQIAFGGQVFRELPLEGFAPSDLVVKDGLVVLAPTDGTQLLCIDGATGEPRWMCERRDMQYVIGIDDELLFVGGEDSITALRFASGVRLWRAELPSFEGSTRWRGRGFVSDGLVVVPGDRCVHVMPADASRPWSTIALPPFRLGRDPLAGPVNLFAHGPWLAAVHAGGIEVLSTARALGAVASQLGDPLRQAIVLAQAGELTAAVTALEAVDTQSGAAVRDEVGRRMVAWCGEIALAHAASGSRAEALAVMDRARAAAAAASSGKLLQRWHLARIELFQALGDFDAIAMEQQTLYKLMETGG